MVLKFRHLSVPQRPQASRHRLVNSTDLTSSQSSHERRDAVGQCGHDAGRHSHLQLDTISRLKRHPFLYTGFESGVETDIALLRVLQEHEFERVGETESIRESKIRSLRINEALQNYQSLSRSHFNTFLSESQSTVPRFRKRCENSQPGCSSSYLVLTT